MLLPCSAAWRVPNGGPCIETIGGDVDCLDLLKQTAHWPGKIVILSTGNAEDARLHPPFSIQPPPLPQFVQDPPFGPCRPALFGRRVILVDDILDEGFTLQGVRDWCMEQGATDVRIAVLTVKQHDRCLAGVKADYAGVNLPDRFVFGFGMDVDESLRSLPAIYAMKQ